MTTPSSHRELYNFPRLYEIAFSFRDLSGEADFIEKTWEAHSGKDLSSFLELGAGPAQTAIEMAKRGIEVGALDLSSAMVEYGRKRAGEEGVDLSYWEGDFVDFSLPQTFEVAALLMDSASYLLTNDQVLSHFQSVARHLETGGLYILEMAHPKNILTDTKTAGNDWEMEEDEIRVHFTWGRDDDHFDPITQITKTTVVLEAQTPDGPLKKVETSPQRAFTATEFEALVRASPDFELREQFGSLDREIPFDNEPEAWRMVSVLVKK